MKHFAITLLAFSALAVFNSDSTSAADRHRRNLHRQLHRDLKHNREVRKQIHHEAHHTPMSRDQHRNLHQDLRHDAYHDRQIHKQFHRQPKHVPSYRGFSLYNGGISYHAAGFRFSFHR